MIIYNNPGNKKDVKGLKKAGLFIILFIMMVTGVYRLPAGKASATQVIEWPGVTEVSLNKAWTVKFNRELDPDSVNSSNMFITDGGGHNRLPAHLELDNNGCTVKIIPLLDYLPGQEYYLYLGQDLRSCSGSRLGRWVRMKFSTREPETVKVSSVSLDRTDVTLMVGEVLQLKEKVVPENAANQEVYWSSDREGVAPVDSEGRVRALAPGTATITVTTREGEKKASCIITVYSPTHQVGSNGIIYGLDFRGDRVVLARAPAEFPPGDYLVDEQYNFFLIGPEGLVYQGPFYYLEYIPYALISLDQPAPPEVTPALLDKEAEKMRPGTPYGGLGEAFMQAQETWGINAIYLLAHSGLESAWGTSAIARDKKNLFGFRAYDENPYENAVSFRSLEDCVLYVSGYIKKNYLNEGGIYYQGANLVGMNHYYATDPMWAPKIANIMERIFAYPGAPDNNKELHRGRVTSSYLNLRSGPGTHFTKLGELPGGAEIEIRGSRFTGNCHWLKVDTPLGQGWVCGYYLELLSYPRGVVFLPGWVANKKASLKLYAKPGETGQAMGELPFAFSLEVAEMKVVNNTSWFRVSYSQEDYEKLYFEDLEEEGLGDEGLEVVEDIDGKEKNMEEEDPVVVVFNNHKHEDHQPGELPPGEKGASQEGSNSRAEAWVKGDYIVLFW